MYSLLLKVPSAEPLCWKLVYCPTEKSQVYPFSTNNFLTSVHVKVYPVTGKIYNKKLYIQGH